MSDDLRYERWIDAPPAVVFEAFVSPGGQEAFYGQDHPGWIVESACDLRIGGTWTIAFGPARDRLYRHRHVFEVIDPPRRLVFATTEDRIDGSTLHFSTEFTFGDHDGQTLLTMVQSGFPTTALRKEHSLGVPTAFDRFQRLVQEPPPPGAGRRQARKLNR